MKAFFYMLLSVLCYSLYPLFSGLIGNKAHPFFFTLVSHFFALIFALILVHYLKIKKVVQQDIVKRLIFERTFIYPLAIAALFSIPAHTLIIAAMKYSNKASITMIYELWPIFAIYLLPIICYGRYRRVYALDLLFSLLAFAGVYLLILGKNFSTEQIDPSFFIPIINQYTLFGYGLALLGSLSLTINSSYAIKASMILEQEFGKVTSAIIVQFFLRFFSFTIGLLLVPFYYKFLSMETLTTIFAYAVLAGIFIHCIGSILYNIANMEAKTANINALWYLTPLIAILWLWLSGLTTITDLVALGAVFIICANLLTTVKGESNTSYISIILWMIFAGTYCYLFNGKEFGDYYNAVSVSSLFYVIVAAFILDRTKARTENEEKLILQIADKLNKSSYNYKNVFNKLLQMTKAKSRAKIHQIYCELISTNVSQLRDLDIEYPVNQLMISKSKIIGFGEKFVLLITGILTLFTSIFFRNNDYFSDIFSVILSTAVVFTYFNVIDTDIERNRAFINTDSNGLIKVTEAKFIETNDERNAAIVMLFSVFVVFCYLLWRKRHVIMVTL